MTKLLSSQKHGVTVKILQMFHKTSEKNNRQDLFISEPQALQTNPLPLI
jgi:hypothetical protein